MEKLIPSGESPASQALAVRGLLAVVGAYTLFSLAAPLTKWLMVHGKELGSDGGAAVSFCNLLTVGNLAAASLVLILTGVHSIFTGLKKLSPLGALSLVSSSSLSIITPAMFFFALHATAVSNVILISRAGPIFYALAATFVLRKKLTRYQWVGYGFIVVAILLAMTWGSPTMLGIGDLLALGAAFGAAMVSITGRYALEQMGLKPFVFTRNIIAAAGFAAIAMVMFGPTHFADLVHPGVVIGVSIYGIFVVGLAQLFWFFAIVHATPKTVSGWSFISPLSAIVLTTVLLHERPHEAQWMALFLVVIGMIIASRTLPLRRQPPPATALSTG
jgi:drug/metabolite transporter (DMT)-like permease